MTSRPLECCYEPLLRLLPRFVNEQLPSRPVEFYLLTGDAMLGTLLTIPSHIKETP